MQKLNDRRVNKRATLRGRFPPFRRPVGGGQILCHLLRFPWNPRVLDAPPYGAALAHSRHAQRQETRPDDRVPSRGESDPAGQAAGADRDHAAGAVAVVEVRTQARVGYWRRHHDSLATDIRPVARWREETAEAGRSQAGSAADRGEHSRPCAAAGTRDRLGIFANTWRVEEAWHRNGQPLDGDQHPSRSGPRPGSEARRRFLERIPDTARRHAVGQRLPHGEDLDHARDRRSLGAVLHSSRHIGKRSSAA